MARVTIEDCLEKVNNRFTIIELAAKRARQISSGTSDAMINSDDKPAVVALREIAAGLVNNDTNNAENTSLDASHDELAELFKDHEGDENI